MFRVIMTLVRLSLPDTHAGLTRIRLVGLLCDQASSIRLLNEAALPRRGRFRRLICVDSSVRWIGESVEFPNQVHLLERCKYYPVAERSPRECRSRISLG